MSFVWKYCMNSDNKKKPLAAKVLISLAAVIVIVGVIGWLFISGKLNLIIRVGNENTINRNEETFDPGDINGNVIDKDEAEIQIDPDDIKLMTDERVVNILLIGSDALQLGEQDRSDTMIICSINRTTKEIKLISLLRDMYVKIPGFSNNRINAAYAFGGMALLDKTIEKNFGIKIDGNVAVNFDSFMEGIAILGDIDIELSKEEAEYMNKEFAWKEWTFVEGMNRLEPGQALEYARMRHLGHGDWDRVDRQKKVIMTAFSKVKDLKWSELNALANKLFPCIATDMDNGTIFNLIRLVYAAKMQISNTTSIPADGTWEYATIDNMGVILPNTKKNSQYLQDYIYGSPESAETTKSGN
jgi:LCP family protein required for cell wall assembly